MRRTIRRLYLVSKNEENPKVLEHRTLRDHLNVEHTAHGYKKKTLRATGRHDASANLTSRIVAEPDPDTFCATNGNESAPVRGSYR
jgi:hypothetical protein